MNNLKNNGKIIDVWADNLQEELKRISTLVDKYNYIAMVANF